MSWAGAAKALLKTVGKGALAVGKGTYKAADLGLEGIEKALKGVGWAVKKPYQGLKFAASKYTGKPVDDITLKNFLFKAADAKDIEKFGVQDRVMQRALGIADVTDDGIQFMKMRKGVPVALVAGSMAITTGKMMDGSLGQSSRGLVSVADNMERFVSYDGSGFVNNVDSVAQGDPAILQDIINHTFTEQKAMFSNNNLSDLVFALHAGREG